MIVVHSTILSLVVSRFIVQTPEGWTLIPVAAMGVLSALSIFFSILAIQPDIRHGDFSIIVRRDLYADTAVVALPEGYHEF